MIAVGKSGLYVGFVVCQSAPAIARLKLQPINPGVFLPLGASSPTGAAHAATKRRARPRSRNAQPVAFRIKKSFSGGQRQCVAKQSRLVGLRLPAQLVQHGHAAHPQVRMGAVRLRSARSARPRLVLSCDVQRGRDVSGLRGAHQARYFLPVTQQHQRGPELDAVAAPQRAT